MASDLVPAGRAAGALVIDRGGSTVLERIEQMQQRMQIITSVMANVLVDGRDYGRVPGTGDKPSLFKAGAEKLMLTFSLAAGEPVIEDLSDDEQIRYRVSVPIVNAEGRVLAVGIGEASTNEEKYRWRRPVCDEEFEATPNDSKRIKWGKDGVRVYQVPQIRTSPADLANTVLKMAHKRGFIGGTLMATGASSVFNQKEGELAKELGDSRLDEAPAPKVKRASERPAAASSSGASVSDARRVKDLRPFGKDKNNYALILEGDSLEYNTKDQKLALELEAFKGTDHRLRVSFKDNDWNGKTYHNIEGFVVDDAAAPAPPPAQAAASSPPPTAGDIPFGR